LEPALNKRYLNTPLARDLAWEMVGSKFEDSGDHYEVIVNEQTDSSRWSAICNLVVKVNDEFFQTTYEKGLTEYQDHGPFEDDGEVVLFIQVVPKEKTVIEYVPYAEDK
jgi:hypothetical protein